MNVLIDTNVILDAMLSRSPFTETAQKLFIMAAEEKINAYVTASSITDIYYLLHRYLHDNERCRQEIFKLIKIFGILDVTGSDCEKALELPMADYEDLCSPRAPNAGRWNASSPGTLRTSAARWSGRCCRTIF